MKKLLFLVFVLIPCLAYAGEKPESNIESTAVKSTAHLGKGCPFPIKKLGSRNERLSREATGAAEATKTMPTVATEPTMMPEEPMAPMPGEGAMGEEETGGASMMPKPVTPTSAVKEMSTPTTTPVKSSTTNITTMPEQPVTAEPATASQDIFKF